MGLATANMYMTRCGVDMLLLYDSIHELPPNKAGDNEV